MNDKGIFVGEIFNIERGGSPRPIQHYLTEDTDSVPWIMIGDTTVGGKYIESTRLRIKKEGIRKSREVYPGELLLTNSMSFGRPYILKTYGCIHDGWLALKPKRNDIDLGYAYHALGSAHAMAQFQKQAAGATVKNLNKDIVASIKIPLPPLEEQRRIAAILDKAAQLTEACASLQDAHRRMGESLFIQAFGEPRTNPLDLPSARLGAIADCQLGKMLDKKRQSGCSKRPYLRNANVRWFEIDTSDVLFMDIGDHEIDRFGVSQGDLLVCEGGEPGRSAIWKGGNGVIGFQKALHRVRADRHKVLPEYLNWALWMFAQRGLLSDHITSATIAHLTREKLVNINILIPPIPVQERFARQLEALNALSQSAKSRNQILRSLNSSTFSTLLGWCAGK